MISWGLLIDCISGFGFFVDGQVPYLTLEMQLKLFSQIRNSNGKIDIVQTRLGDNPVYGKYYYAAREYNLCMYIEHS